MYAIRKSKKFQFKKILFVSFSILLIFYCAYQAINGERGVSALFYFSKKYNNLKEEIETLRAERLSIENKVNALKSESLDIDLLDEQARRVLGYAHEGETIYIDSNEATN
jgi:cell division protein FtsB